MLRPLLAAAAVALAAFPGADAAHAICPGTQQLGEVCVVVDPAGLPTVTFGWYSDCVTVDGRCVVPFRVPIPNVSPGSGDPVDVYCRGGSIRCTIL